MSTDLLEHFNNIEVKDWDLYQHNYGLKPTPKYKFGFMTKYGGRNFRIYNTFGSEISVIQTSQTILRGIKAVPSKGCIVTASMDSSGNTTVQSFDVKTGTLLGSWTASTWNGSGVSGLSFDVFDNGDIAIFNHANGRLTITDYLLTVKQEVSDLIYNNPSSAHSMHINSKRKVIAIVNDRTNVTNIYDKATIGNKVPRITLSTSSSFIKGFTEKGNLVHVTTGGQVRIHRIDYLNNVESENQYVNVQLNNYTTTFLRTIKNKIYVRNFYNYINQLVEIDEDNGAFIRLTMPGVYSPTLRDIDDKYLYITNVFGYSVYSRSDSSLLIDIPSNYDSKDMLSTKGDYVDFGKYW